ncbi:MAG TPA: bifunctional UDP-N-acetylglucosamine diphosphorylase/glucosamine-1-phosphate N-acetyltransferase GlmU [Polyangiaceae bacterium]|nr:bifunctional UDP-N-acetylglucosamine diphosphorylase/glucosamine-1-phosphate N-acetyltransferase GlmU [Polyangiaceae bacterium]
MSVAPSLTAVILAAGAGTRMKSRLSKVLHPLAGRPLLHYPLLAAHEAGARHLVVVASPANRDAVAQCLDGLELDATLAIAIQQSAQGTGDAAKAALGSLTGERVLILCGDTPLVRGSDLTRLIQETSDGKSFALMSCRLADPTGYGRILRDSAGRVQLVREQKDLKSNTEREVSEVNAGIYCLPRTSLEQALAKVDNQNASGEYYLTDIVGHRSSLESVLAVQGDAEALQGVNDRVQLGSAEQVLFERIRQRHQRAGVTVQAGVQIDDTVQIGNDCRLNAAVVLLGRTRLGSDVRVDHGCVIEDSVVDDAALIKPYSVITQSHVGARAQIGPFAHLRPDSELEADVHVGNFVETKKTLLRQGAKANHLAYLGDGEVGEGSNIGAGTIFCNYDGFSKARTVIGKGVFIGSDSQLIAPVNIGDGAYVGTGTTVTESVPAGSLALSRLPQTTKLDYAERLRTKLAERAKHKK